MLKLENLVAAVFDTHVWVWSAAGDPRAAAVSGFSGLAIVSAISVWEVAMLESKGRVHLNPDPDAWMRKNLAPPVSLEPLSAEISLESCRLPGFHGDPADRIIVATASVLGVPLLTADQGIREWNEHHRRVHLVVI